jgi:hypothetical protein
MIGNVAQKGEIDDLAIHIAIGIIGKIMADKTELARDTPPRVLFVGGDQHKIYVGVFQRPPFDD